MIEGLDDSKNLSEARREALYPLILERALAVSWVIVEASECDRMGIQAANIHALRQSVLDLTITPGFVITDGFAVPGLTMPSVGMWKGDKVSPCVSAASIVAKVTRDRIMNDLDKTFPDYEFSKHKGYATALHQRHLDELGPCTQHRMSYGNVARTTRVGQS
jgi:ribonuclease HII